MGEEIRGLKTDYKVMRFDEMRPAPVNARFMIHEEFVQLVENIRRDGCLTSTPLVAEMDGEWTIISGNHRCKAAQKAGIEETMFQRILTKIPKERLIAIQLSHNAIAGDDDQAVLKQLYDAVQGLDDRKYTGLDDNSLALLTDVSIEPMGVLRLDYQSLHLLFLPEEIDQIKEVLEEVPLVGSDETWGVRMRDYEEFMERMEDVGSVYSIRAMALKLVRALELIHVALPTLRAEVARGGQVDDVTVASVVGSATIPPKVAQKVSRSIEKWVSRNGGEGWKAILEWAEQYDQSGNVAPANVQSSTLSSCSTGA